MPTITFRQTDGSEQVVDAESGESVMKAAVLADIVGIFGECGGNVTCATCKVGVDPAWASRIDAPTDLEQSLIEDEPAGCRLSCQLTMSAALDGIVVTVPESQYG